MGALSRILPLNNILLGLNATSKKRIFEQAAFLFEKNYSLAKNVVFDSLLARERLGSTALGQGVALPHGQIKGLNDTLAAFIRLEKPIAFHAPDGQPIHLLLFLLVPNNAAPQHLAILAELARLLSDKLLRSALSLEIDPIVVHRILSTGQL